MRPARNHDTATKIPQMINDQSRRLMAIAPIQGSGDECRSCRTSCVDRGMAYPSDFAAGSTTRSVAVPAHQLGGGGIESTSLRNGCLHSGMHIAKTGSLWRHQITNQAPARRYPSPLAVQRDRLADRTMLRIAGRTMLRIA